VKDRGPLKYPTRAVQRLCCFAEKVIRKEFPGLRPNAAATVDVILDKIRQNVPAEALLKFQPSSVPSAVPIDKQDEFLRHLSEKSHFNGRMTNREFLFRTVAKKYVEVRINHINCEYIRKLRAEAKTKSRHKLRKLIHQTGQ
jgi:hypothetical protein